MKAMEVIEEGVGVVVGGVFSSPVVSAELPHVAETSPV